MLLIFRVYYRLSISFFCSCFLTLFLTLFVFLTIRFFIYVYFCLFLFFLSLYLGFFKPVWLSVFGPVWLCVCVPICMCVFVPVCLCVPGCMFVGLSFFHCFRDSLSLFRNWALGLSLDRTERGMVFMVFNLVLLLDGNSEHVAHALRTMILFWSKNIRFLITLDLIKYLKQVTREIMLYMDIHTTQGYSWCAHLFLIHHLIWVQWFSRTSNGNVHVAKFRIANFLHKHKHFFLLCQFNKEWKI